MNINKENINLRKLNNAIQIILKKYLQTYSLLSVMMSWAMQLL